MPNMESERKLNTCDNCPEKPGRFCTSYRNGKSRLVYDPLPDPKGRLRYDEPYERSESIQDCLKNLIVAKERQKGGVKSYEKSGAGTL